MLRRERSLAMITLSLLIVFTCGAGTAVANLTPQRRLTPQPPSVAGRVPVRAMAAPLPAADPAAPLPSGSSLGSRLAALAAGPGGTAGAGRRIGMAVIDASTRRTLYDDGGQRPATPASTTKLVTSVAALAALGPGHRLTTRVVQGAAGSIVLVGGGDPTLTARAVAPDVYPRYASLTELARQTAAALTASGTRQIRVNFDTSLYEGPQTAAGWKPNYLPDGEVAPLTALTVDEGRIGIGESERVADPGTSAAKTFAKMLGRYGISAKLGRRATVAKAAAQLAAVQSPPLTVLIEHMMTVSDNDVAETLIRHVAVKKGRPASFAGGAQAVMDVLTQLGVGEGVQVNDGSGLSTRNRITPLALARIASLAASSRRPELRAAITGMPVAGFTGTLSAPRYTGPATQVGAGVVRAKTGTLAGVSTLAGIAYDADGRLLAFAFMLGDGKSRVDPGKLDLLAAAVASCGCR